MLDNSTMIHGKLHPMMAIVSIGPQTQELLGCSSSRSGDCELMVLRQTFKNGRLRQVDQLRKRTGLRVHWRK